MWKLLSSVATAAGQRHFAGFPTIGAIVETVRAKADILLPLADGAVLFTGAAIFRQVALRTKRRTLHKGLSRKLYLSMGGCGKVKVGNMRESLNSYLECAQFPITRLELSRWRGGRFACYAPHVMPQRSASHCGSRTCSFSKYRKTKSLQMTEKIEFP
jgi:hypothetical protein